MAKLRVYLLQHAQQLKRLLQLNQMRPLNQQQHEEQEEQQQQQQQLEEGGAWLAVWEFGVLGVFFETWGPS